MIQQMWDTVAEVSGARTPRLIVVAGGSVFFSNTDLTALTAATDGDDVFDPDVIPEGAQIGAKLYIVDGSATDLFYVDLSAATPTFHTATESAGTFPAGCTLCCEYRGRLVLSGTASDSQNYFASRSGDPLDFDYSQSDDAAAFAGNNIAGGKIGDKITALMPYVRDYLAIGGDHSIYQMTGDIAEGGRIDRVTDQVGVLGPRAICQDPSGTRYFVGTQGFFQWPLGGQPQNLTAGRFDQYFQAIDRDLYYILCDWDRDNHLCVIHVSPKVEGPAVHLVWDARHDAFWPIQYPNWYGPVSTAIFDGNAPGDRMMCLGARAGYVLRWSRDAITDKGVAIESQIMLGPVEATGEEGNEAKLQQLDVTFGEVPDGFDPDKFNVDVTVNAGADNYAAVGDPTRQLSKTYTTPRRQTPEGMNVREVSFAVQLSNTVPDRWWIYELIKGVFVPGSRRR